ncbi:MAG: hypothetical protein DMF61_22955 [Blastocatellia bacterium AA13]|nr:MAG: hypothetical protein DMF61_22955 [Blastocatellia bacterium AA13]
MTRELRPAQLDAAHDLGRHISVTAGPGAGKTTVLVERYLHILRTQDVSVDQIVAITFTNRAANEMRERLRSELSSLVRLSTGYERARWIRHKRTLDGGVITTIHGFCSRLLHEFPVEAGIDPQFKLLDEHQSSILLETAVEEALTAFINSGHEAITRLTAGVGRQALVMSLIEIYRSIRNPGLTIERVRELTEANHSTAADYAEAVERLDEVMERFAQKPGLSPASGKKRAAAVDAWREIRNLLTNPPSSFSLAVYCQAVEDFRKTRPPARDPLKDIVTEIDGLIWNDELGGQVPQLFFDLYAREASLELIGVIERVGRELAAKKVSLAALDFDDLQLEALRLLNERPDAQRRTASRYRFFLVDEFQDTNGLQRELMNRLALSERRANLFIVGDRKQSIYGFRGADVDLFREMSSALEEAGGQSKSLTLNFRSQAPLIHFFNYLFERIFTPGDDADVSELNELGFVEHEPGIAERPAEDAGPLVEILIDLKDQEADSAGDWNGRERDAEQLALKIQSLVDANAAPRVFRYLDIALLFRSLTEVSIYESAFRRAGIPYQTIEGKGFYAKEEIVDLIQLLRFLDNTTDELALAAILRSPLVGISDDTLLALRCAPEIDETSKAARVLGTADELRLRRGVRGLLNAVRNHELIDLITDEDHRALDPFRALIETLIDQRNRLGIADLLRFTIETSEYRTVIAAAFDGAQRLANVDKLFDLAERFEASGAHMIRDFVRFVYEFERSGAREGEGRIDDSANAVRLMTIHQAKGLEFPIVIMPELQRQLDIRQDWWLLDRHLGLTAKVPDGRGARVTGFTMKRLRDRAGLREQFESMRLMYVAATRARDRLIFSGAAARERELCSGRHNWLSWICESLGIAAPLESKLLKLTDNLEVQLTANLLDSSTTAAILREPPEHIEAAEAFDAADPLPLLMPVARSVENAAYTFTVTQLMNHGRCPRQYYFDRVLHAPSGDEIAFWNNAEAPEPPANLTATIRGAVIHRFCERYDESLSLDDCLRRSLDEVLKLREAELGDRIREVEPEKALRELRPLAENYLNSNVRTRITETLASAGDFDGIGVGVFNEQHFRIRRPLGFITGTIDKLLVRGLADGDGLSAEIIDFKTNRFRTGLKMEAQATIGEAKASAQAILSRRSRAGAGQLAFNFESQREEASLLGEVNRVALEYRLQAQAYALAVRELMPSVKKVRVAFHFLHPNIEVSVASDLLEHKACAIAVEEAMSRMISSNEPESFPAKPAEHCYSCSFREICFKGSEWIAAHSG